jgi:histidine triad (HIT) family protein
MSDSCVFCAIVAGDLPSHQVWRGDGVRVLMDAFPACEGHVLVIPEHHVENIFELDDLTARDVASVARRAAAAIRSVLSPDGLTISQANGIAANQTVPHYHVHLMPRTTGERLGSHGTSKGDNEALANLAARLSDAMSAT